MKRITFIALLAGLSVFGAQANNNSAQTNSDSYKVDSQVLKENNFRNAPWMESNNTAGLAFRPIEMYKDLNISYENNSGEFRLQQEANNINNINVNTSGSTYLGKFLVWGSFSFQNIIQKGSNFNALMYEIEDDMPYYPIDTTKNSRWQKQKYELQAKLASPVLWDRVSFGVDLNYVNKVGAKQLDPRAETYKYSLIVKPSVAVRLGKNYIGLSGTYQNGHERSVPRNMNNWVDQRIYKHKGLGESVIGKAGGNDGIKTYMFKNNEFGGALQYGYAGNSELLADIAFLKNKTDVISNPKLPYKEGSTNRTEIQGKVTYLFGNEKSDCIWVDGQYRSTEGTEYIQKITTESNTHQYYAVISENVMCKYTNVLVSFGYDHQFGNDDARGYDWIVGAKGDFLMKNEIYYLPESTFSATTFFADVFGGKQFKFDTSSLLIKINGGYGMGLGASYIYTGKNVSYTPVLMYHNNCAYYNTAYAKGGGQVSYTINTKKIGYIFNVMADYIKPMGVATSRLVANASVGIVF